MSSSANQMDTILLAGGQGMRLRPLTARLPKPLLPVANRPLVSQILHGLAASGIKRAALATGYKADAMQSELGAACEGVELRHIVESAPLGSGGALHNVVAECAVTGEVWIAGADILHNVDIAAVRKFHRAAVKRGGLVTIVSAEVEDATGFGICEADSDGRVGRFLEKPPAGATRSRLANTALWVFSRAALEMLPAGPSSIERDLFPALAARGALWTWSYGNGFWLDCGTPSRLVEANLGALAGKFPARLHGDRSGDSLLGTRCQMDDAARVSQCVLGEDVIVKQGAILDACVLLEGAFVGEGVRLERCIVEHGAHVKAGTTARNKILT